MKLIRRLHLYLGCFFAPMLLFYVLTGWYQTINPERLKSPSEAETFLQKARTVHVDQIYPSDQEFEKPSKPAAFKFLAVVMCIAATATIVLGLILSFKTLKNPWPVVVSIVLGVVLPVLMLYLGQGR